MKGILFKPDMIQAIVEGRKTQTRRLDGLKEINKESDAWCLPINYIYQTKSWEFYKDINKSFHVKPRYQIGETVYIKEACAIWSDTEDCIKTNVISHTEALEYVIYKLGHKDWAGIVGDAKRGHPWNIKSPLFMPQWAARYFIKILDVRAERLQEITEEDANAEGVGFGFQMNAGYPDYQHIKDGVCELTQDTPVQSFASLWDTINKPPYDWKSNSWVWVYTFRRENEGG